MKKSIILLIFLMCTTLLLTLFTPALRKKTEGSFRIQKIKSSTQDNTTSQKEKSDEVVIEYNSWDECKIKMPQDLSDLNDVTKMPGKEYNFEFKSALLLDDTQKIKTTFRKTIK